VSPPPDELLRVDVSAADDRVVISLDGELDCASAPQLQEAVDTVLRRRPDRVVVAADGLSFVDVAGLRPLLALREGMGEGRVQLRNARRPIVRVLRLLDLSAELGLDG
jgi:anti-anti-sigma factor